MEYQNLARELENCLEPVSAEEPQKVTHEEHILTNELHDTYLQPDSRT